MTPDLTPELRPAVAVAGQDPAATLGVSTGDLRRRTLLTTVVAVGVVIAIVVAAAMLLDTAGAVHLTERQQGPAVGHPFGTDWLGRDVLARVIVGLRLSLTVGLLAACCSATLALVLAGLASTFRGWVEDVVTWLVDLFLSIPHLVLLILITFALGGGTRAVIAAVGLTHWPSLTRILLARGRVVAASDYVALSTGFGRSRAWITWRHIVPHLLPHTLVGAVLLVPHAILHEAALSFLGLGVDPSDPAVGVLLRESMRFLSTGQWWLALLPGLSLLVIVKVIDTIGDNVRLLIDPRSHHR